MPHVSPKCRNVLELPKCTKVLEYHSGVQCWSSLRAVANLRLCIIILLSKAPIHLTPWSDCLFLHRAVPWQGWGTKVFLKFPDEIFWRAYGTLGLKWLELFTCPLQRRRSFSTSRTSTCVFCPTTSHRSQTPKGVIFRQASSFNRPKGGKLRWIFHPKKIQEIEVNLWVKTQLNCGQIFSESRKS